MITKFKIFENHLDIDPYGEEDWSGNDDFLGKIIEICQKFPKNSETLYLKDPVVGEKDGQEVLCNYLYLHDVDVVFHLLFDEKPSDVYDKDYEFTYVTYNDLVERKGFVTRHRAGDEKYEWQFNLVDNFVELIYNEMTRPGYEDWMEKVNQAREFNDKIMYRVIKSNDGYLWCPNDQITNKTDSKSYKVGDYVKYIGRNPNYHGKNGHIEKIDNNNHVLILFDQSQMKFKDLPFDDRIQYFKNKVYLSFLVNRYNSPYDIQQIKDMETMGQKEYDEREDARSKMMMNLLKEE